MSYIYLLAAITTTAGLAIAGMLFNKNIGYRKGFGSLYNLIGSCANFTVWLIMFLASPSFGLQVLPYSLGYAICYALFWTGLTGGLQSGSSALTSFLKQIAFVFVSVWGFVFWGTTPTAAVVSGMVLIAVALYLCLVPIGKGATTATVKISKKWLVYGAMILVSNAGCMILQKTQQLKFNGQYGNQLMVFATFFAFIFCLIMFLNDGKKDFGNVMRKNWIFPVLAGGSSALCNLFIILLASTTLSPSLIYPALAIGGLAMTTLVSVVICKEKLKLSQWIGLAIGAVALVFLNI